MRDIKFKAYYPTLGLSEPFKLGEYPKWGNETLSYWSDRCIFEQFTGLLDKNGKDVYEGDIVRTKHKYNKEVNVGLVYFENFQWFCAGDYMAYAEEYCVIEIIGNKHSTPELLEAKT